MRGNPISKRIGLTDLSAGLLLPLTAQRVQGDAADCQARPRETSPGLERALPFLSRWRAKRGKRTQAAPGKKPFIDTLRIDDDHLVTAEAHRGRRFPLEHIRFRLSAYFMRSLNFTRRSFKWTSSLPLVVVRLVCVLFLGVTLQASASEPTLIRFTEEFDEQRLVAGVDIYLAAGRESNYGIRVGHGFFADIASRNFHRMCVAIRSRDAKYNAIAHFDISGVDPGRHHFPILTNYGSQLRRYSWDSLAVQLRITDDCENESGQILLATPLDRAAQSDLQLVLFVQALGAEAHLVSEHDNAHVKCEKLPETDQVASVAFDTICKLSEFSDSHSIRLFDILGVLTGTRKFQITPANRR